MGLSVTNIAVNLFRTTPIYSSKSLNSEGSSNIENTASDSDVQFTPDYADKLSISQEYYLTASGQYKTKEELKAQEKDDKKNNIEDKDKKQKTGKSESKNKSSIDKRFSPEEEQAIRNLEKRDAEVRRHEETHKAVGGALVKGGASYSYETGPDGKQYAIGGEVQIDMSPIEGDPEATIRKMQQVQRAALAPAEPSGQDYSVATAAGKNEALARIELSKQNAEGIHKDSSNKSTGILKQKSTNIKSFNLLI